jgi:hypothetical protein
MTKNDSLIAIAYHANSTENYSKNISEFENSVKTIRISEPGDIKESAFCQDYKVPRTSLA